MLTLTSHHLQAINDHSEQLYANECCGLLIGSMVFENGTWHKTLHTIQPTLNSWEDQEEVPHDKMLTNTRRYWIAPSELIQTQKVARSQGCDIIGVYHSHPDHPAVPSDCDLQWAWPQYSYIIVSVQQGTAYNLQSWMLDEQGSFQPEQIVIIQT